MTVYTSLPVSKIVNDYQAGESLLALGAKHGVSKGTIRNVLAAANVPLRNPGHHAAAHVPTHVVNYKYAYRSFGLDELDSSPLHPQEVARLRRAIGWKAEWADSYDLAGGD